MRIYIDADGWPVKQEVYRVTKRYGLHVCVVANAWMETPPDPNVERITVPAGADAADDRIVEHVETADLVVTTDIPLASRCVAKGVAALHPTGRPFTDASIGSAVAMRDLLKSLREAGERTRGPPPFADRDRSQILQALDAAIQCGRRARWTAPSGS